LKEIDDRFEARTSPTFEVRVVTGRKYDVQKADAANKNNYACEGWSTSV
jgi:hypothetical protein